MRTEGLCNSCGFRLPASSFPVAKENPERRVLAVCTPCLENLVVSDVSLAVRPPTAAEERVLEQLASAMSIKRKHSHNELGPRKRVAEDSAPEFTTCRICCEDKLTADDFIQRMRRGRKGSTAEMPYKCQPHLCLGAAKGPVCKTCIGKSLVAAMESKAATSVGCLDCGTAWVSKYVQQYVSQDDFAAYSHELLRLNVTLRPNFVWCPHPHCEAGGLTYKSTRGWPQVVCNGCGIRICADCKVEWHTGISCPLAKATRRYGDSEMANLKRLQAIDARMCPRCHCVIEKNGGCPNMNCAKCKKTFRWDVAEPVIAIDIDKKMKEATEAIVKSSSSDIDKNCEIDAERGTAAKRPAKQKIATK